MSKERDYSSHWRKILELPYLNGSELQGEVLVTIKERKRENFFSPSTKKKEDHTILYFNELIKGMVLNQRKAAQLERILGTPLMDEWVGKTITLYSVEEKHFGIIYPVITVKRGVRVLPKLTDTHKRWNVAVSKLRTGETTIEAIKKSFEVSVKIEKQLLKESENEK